MELDVYLMYDMKQCLLSCMPSLLCSFAVDFE